MKKHRFLNTLSVCLLTLTVVLSLVLLAPTKAQAATSGYYTYTVSSGKATITDYSGSATNLTIPSKLGGYIGVYPVTGIGNYAFSGCTSLQSVTIPDSVTSIGDYAFSGCDNLASVTIGNSVESIGNYAFSGCDNLASVTIGNSVESIGVQAFYYCTSLGSVTIPDSVMSIGNSAFYRCISLASVTIPDSVTSIGNEAFPYCTSLTGIWVDENNTAYSSDSYGVLFNKDKTTLVQTPGSISGNYTIPNSVTSIGNSAFRGCDSLESVTIPDSVTSIGNSAFYSCTSLGSVTFGNSVTSIGNRAFYNCTSLESVTFGNSVTSIGDYAFRGCDSLESVTIPDSVTSIGDQAFYNCYDLTNVYYGGTQSQWESIGIGSSNGCLTSATVHYQHIHDYTLFPSVTAEPACTKDGYIEYTCIWGETYRQMIPALGHDYTVFVNTAAPTCTAEGYTTYKCSRCTATTNTDYVGALDHDYTVLAETVAPTCLDDGYSVYRCVRCEQTQTRDQVPALGHDYTVHVETVAPTCLDGGYSVYRCVRCEETQTRDQVPALGHDYSGTVTVVEPTCKEQGYTGTQCIRCDSIQKTNITNVVAHKLVILPAVDPTCTEPGLTLGTACKWCGLVGVAQKEVAALGGNCDYTADPTICSNCGYVRADVDITNVVLRPTCSGLYFKGSFTFGAHENVSRYGIAVSLYNDLPVADGSDETSLYTVGENSVLISNILGEGKTGKDLIYARPYALLEDGTYIYGDVVATNLKAVVETIDTQVFDSLTTAQKTAIADMYLQHTAAMQNWLIPKIKEFGEA